MSDADACKRCARCREAKPLDAFGTRGGALVDSYCRRCRCLLAAAYATRMRGERLAWARRVGAVPAVRAAAEAPPP